MIQKYLLCSVLTIKKIIRSLQFYAYKMGKPFRKLKLYEIKTYSVTRMQV